ncbi:hypothetical protein NMY22_g14702 [Coprinellus aureogranulatus]|nr:hypothetical protein NMY22_g14702 [Coprinellus aureogranulatus]
MSSWRPTRWFLEAEPKDPKMTRHWTRKRKTMLKDVDFALQIQYVVTQPKRRKGDSGSGTGTGPIRRTFKIQGINVFAAERVWGRCFRLDASLYGLVSLLTKKQWALKLYWDERVRGKEGKGGLPMKLVNLLAGYVLYYEDVLDALLPQQKRTLPDVAPVQRWIKAEVFANRIHTPIVDGWITGLDFARTKIRVEQMIKDDPWGIAHYIKLERMSSLDARERASIVAEIDKWLHSHDETVARLKHPFSDDSDDSITVHGSESEDGEE